MREKQTDLPIVIAVDDLDAALDTYTRLLGFKLEMITPADSPTAAVVSGHGTTIRLERRVSEPPAVAGGLTLRVETSDNTAECLDNTQSGVIVQVQPPATAGGSDMSSGGTDRNAEWVTGRAGMEYRDLIPGRLDGRVIASHIRIPNGGEVADYVHYHKVRFQMIYCVAGSIRVVYEDQGGPFWLNPGDCVLQPPQIRHRVIEAEANSEVVEIGMPAVHETWADHELKLPTGRILPAREFSGQRFVRHIAAGAEWNEGEFAGFESRDTGISNATNGLADVHVLRAVSGGILPANYTNEREFLFCFVLKGVAKLWTDNGSGHKFTAGDSAVVTNGAASELRAAKDSEILCVCV